MPLTQDPAHANETPPIGYHAKAKILNFTCSSALLVSLKICPTTRAAEVIFSAVNRLASAVKNWASAEILFDFVVMLSICLKGFFFQKVKCIQGFINVLQRLQLSELKFRWASTSWASHPPSSSCLLFFFFCCVNNTESRDFPHFSPLAWIISRLPALVIRLCNCGSNRVERMNSVLH